MSESTNTPKTNFTFEIQYPALPDGSASMPTQDIDALAPLLQALLAEQDSAASVTMSDTHRGANNRIVELVTAVQDDALGKLLEGFSAQYGVNIKAIE
ncbi:MAG: hypothetical protein EOO54_26780 [Haliea sp.]|nr:MAG: hypothetical protein EOO54_26780 [Haliea sp.]